MGQKLGELLVAEGRISQGVLARALQVQGTQGRGLRLGAILLRWGLVSESVLLEALSAHHRCPAVDWETLSKASKEAVRLLSPAQSTRLGAVPYASDRKTVRVAFANPSNLAAVDEVQAITGKRVLAAVTTEVRLLQAQQYFYKRPLDRNVWTVLQKMEAPRIADPAPLAAPPSPGPPSPEIEPRGVPVEPESTPEKGAASAHLRAAEFEDQDVEQRVDETIEDLGEPAPVQLIESIKATVATESAQESFDQAEQTIPVLAGKAADVHGLQSFLEGLPLAELLADRIDPFADDTPLADFIEQALSFYEAHPTFQSALAALDDDSVEILDPALEQERPPQGFSLDSTLPSPRGAKRDSGEDLAI